MKATELRIGNWVILDNVGNNYPVNKEIEIDNFNVLEDFYAGGRQYSGIPLTEDWLIKFCLELKIMNKDLNWENEVGKWDDEDDFYYIIESYCNDYGTYCYVTKKIQYVHQLQNLMFALTGEELTVK